MKLRTNLVCLLSMSICLTVFGTQPRSHVNVSERTLQALVNEAARTTLEKFADKNLKDDQLSITLIDLRHLQRPVTASYRGMSDISASSETFYCCAHRG